jgi:hypothetical protein
MRGTLGILQGELLPLAQEAEVLYDVSPEWVDEAVFEAAHRALDELLPSGNSLAQRVASRRHRTEVEFDRVKLLLGDISAELRRRTKAWFPLPAGEAFDLRFVADQPYYANNCYLGGFRSRLDISTDLPLHITELVYLIAHEAYAGHHTEFSIKESRLAQGKDRLEHTVALLNSPSCVVSEGIASRALAVLMTDSEQIAWHGSELFPRAGFDHLNACCEHTIAKYASPFGALAGVKGNTAFLLHDRGASEDEAEAYLRRFGLLSSEEARTEIEFIRNPLFRSYVFTYRCGGELVERLLAGTDDPKRSFTRLLSEPLTPSQIRSWMAD